MIKSIAIWLLLAISVGGFAYCWFFYARFLKTGGTPTSVFGNSAALPNHLQCDRIQTLRGVVVFSVSLVLMLLISAIWGPA